MSDHINQNMFKRIYKRFIFFPLLNNKKPVWGSAYEGLIIQIQDKIKDQIVSNQGIFATRQEAETNLDYHYPDIGYIYSAK